MKFSLKGLNKKAGAKFGLLFFSCVDRHSFGAKMLMNNYLISHDGLCFLSQQGSGMIKAGFAGDQIPKYCFPN